jgi:hypothetical protein
LDLKAAQKLKAKQYKKLGFRKINHIKSTASFDPKFSQEFGKIYLRELSNWPRRVSAQMAYCCEETTVFLRSIGQLNPKLSWFCIKECDFGISCNHHL